MWHTGYLHSCYQCVSNCIDEWHIVLYMYSNYEVNSLYGCGDNYNWIANPIMYYYRPWRNWLPTKNSYKLECFGQLNYKEDFNVDNIKIILYFLFYSCKIYAMQSIGIAWILNMISKLAILALLWYNGSFL